MARELRFTKLPTQLFMMKHFLQDRIGFRGEAPRAGDQDDETAREYINLKLASRSFPIVGEVEDFPFLEMARSLILNFQERLRLLESYRAPVDTHISNWLEGYLEDTDVFVRGESMLPNPLVLERHGLARLLSLPAEGDKFESDIVSSYRTWQGGVIIPPRTSARLRGCSTWLKVFANSGRQACGP